MPALADGFVPEGGLRGVGRAVEPAGLEGALTDFEGCFTAGRGVEEGFLRTGAVVLLVGGRFFARGLDMVVESFVGCFVAGTDCRCSLRVDTRLRALECSYFKPLEPCDSKAKTHYPVLFEAQRAELSILLHHCAGGVAVRECETLGRRLTSIEGLPDSFGDLGQSLLLSRRSHHHVSFAAQQLDGIGRESMTAASGEASSETNSGASSQAWSEASGKEWSEASIEASSQVSGANSEARSEA